MSFTDINLGEVVDWQPSAYYLVSSRIPELLPIFFTHILISLQYNN